MSLSYSITPDKIKKKRCPNGTYRNKKTGNCEPKENVRKRCPNGTYRNKKTGNCEPKTKKTSKKRCPNGTYRNKKTGNCEPKKIKKSFTPLSSDFFTPIFPLSTKIPSKERNVIQNFMLKTTNKRRTQFLKTVCSDSGVCLAFGQETKKINDFFGGFTNFHHITGIKQIGKPSSNGYVLEIQYTREDYIAHTILKNALKKTSDNLAYEFFVGQFINKKSVFFPCFLETYGMFLRQQKNIQNLRQELTLISNKPEAEIYKISCQESENISILIQHISNAQTLSDKLKQPIFNNNELLYVLYQVYMPLMCLQNEFTHYDLHVDNVLIYEPVIGKYIQYHYFVDGTEITFKSKYIAKIIDYGRCYFYDSDTNNSMIIHNKICQESICNTRYSSCGEIYGYSWLNGEGLSKDNYYIDSTRVNISHDLRLLHEITRAIQYINIPVVLNDFLQKVQYGVGIQDRTNKRFGTEPNINSGIPTTINNIQDAYWMLESLVDNMNSRLQNENTYVNMTKLGDLHIFNEISKPMQFIPHK
jgi:hypothetical protein